MLARDLLSCSVLITTSTIRTATTTGSFNFMLYSLNLVTNKFVYLVIILLVSEYNEHTSKNLSVRFPCACLLLVFSLVILLMHVLVRLPSKNQLSVRTFIVLLL